MNNLNIQENLMAAIIIPDKDIIPGAETLSPAFIVFENYEKILNWNRSLRFALAVCTLKENFKNEIINYLYFYFLFFLVHLNFHHQIKNPILLEELLIFIMI